MKKLIVILAFVAIPSTSSAGLFCDAAAQYSFRAGWANVACIMEIMNNILLNGYDDGFDNLRTGGDSDDLGG